MLDSKGQLRPSAPDITERSGSEYGLTALDHRVVGSLIPVLRDKFTMLANIAVDPSCAGRWIGRGLLEYAETGCRRLQMKEL